MAKCRGVGGSGAVAGPFAAAVQGLLVMRLSTLLFFISTFSLGVYGYASVFSPLGGSSGGTVASGWHSLLDERRIIKLPEPETAPGANAVAADRGHGSTGITAPSVPPPVINAARLRANAGSAQAVAPVQIPPPAAAPRDRLASVRRQSGPSEVKVIPLPKRLVLGPRGDDGTARVVGVGTATRQVPADRIVTGSIGPPPPPRARANASRRPATFDLTQRSSLGGPPAPPPSLGVMPQKRSGSAEKRVARLTPAGTTVSEAAHSSGSSAARSNSASRQSSQALPPPTANPLRKTRLARFAKAVAPVADAMPPSVEKAAVPKRLVRQRPASKRTVLPPSPGARSVAALSARQDARQALAREKKRSKRAAIRKQRKTARRAARAKARVRRVSRSARPRRFRSYRKFQAYRNRVIANEIRRRRYMRLGFY